MSYITFDYRCSSCKQEDTRLVKREDMDSQRCENGTFHTPGQPMVRLPASPRTTFLFADRKLKR